MYILRCNTQPSTPETPTNSCEWFGESLIDSQAQPIYSHIAAWLRTVGNGAALKRSAVGTGLDLLHHVLPIHGTYPQLTHGYQCCIRERIPAHRIERLQLSAPTDVEYDQRVAWLGHCRNVPVSLGGDIEHDRRPIFEIGRQGFYNAILTVPRDWHSIGLVPSADPLDGYPATPGTEFAAWLDYAEIRLLQKFNWSHTIRERMLFDRSQGKASLVDPLRKWSELMARRLEGPTLTPLMRKALRSMALHPIGAFHGYRAMEHFAAGDDGWQTVEGIVTRDRDGGHTVRKPYEFVADMRGQWSHPEWAKCIIARTRAATVEFIINNNVPLREIVAIKDDGVVLRHALPGIVDDGRVGHWRLKHAQK